MGSNSSKTDPTFVIGQQLSKKNEPKALVMEYSKDQTSAALCTKNLISLSPNLGLLVNLSSLQVCCNQLTTLPEEIGYLKNLKYLSAARNMLVKLPDSIGNLCSLTELKLGHNKIERLPKSIVGLSKLNVLDLEFNNISELPVEIGQLTELMSLDLTCNQIQILPAEIQKLKNMRRMIVLENPLNMEVQPPARFILPSLKEQCARQVVRHNLHVIQNLQDQIVDFLISAQECSFCGGPFFEYFVERKKFISRNDFQIPVCYRLCIAHWNSEEERVSEMFRPEPQTAMRSSRSTISLFNQYSSQPSPKKITKSFSMLLLRSKSKESMDSIPLEGLVNSPSLPMLSLPSEAHIEEPSDDLEVVRAPRRRSRMFFGRK